MLGKYDPSLTSRADPICIESRICVSSVCVGTDRKFSRYRCDGVRISSASCSSPPELASVSSCRGHEDVLRIFRSPSRVGQISARIGCSGPGLSTSCA